MADVFGVNRTMSCGWRTRKFSMSSVVSRLALTGWLWGSDKASPSTVMAGSSPEAGVVAPAVGVAGGGVAVGAGVWATAAARGTRPVRMSRDKGMRGSMAGR